MGKFIVSVGDAMGLDPSNNDAFLFQSKTEMDGSFSVAMDSTEVRAGFGNQKIFDYFHTRTLDVELMSAEWDFRYLAMNVGKNIISEVSDAWIYSECVTLSSGSGTLSEEPVGDIFVEKQDGSMVTVTPAGTSFTVVGGLNTSVDVTYKRSTMADTLTVDAETSPKIIKLIQQYKIFDQQGQVGVLEITIPRFQISGNFDLTMTPDGVSSTPLSGTSLAFKDSGCSRNVYAYVKEIPMDGSKVKVTAIVASPSAFEPSDSGGSQQVTVTGIRGEGGMYGALPISTSDCTFSMATGSDSEITVDSSGLITVASGATTGDTGNVKIVYTLDNALEDYVYVEVQ